jgi:hypothetical protein
VLLQERPRNVKAAVVVRVAEVAAADEVVAHRSS